MQHVHGCSSQFPSQSPQGAGTPSKRVRLTDPRLRKWQNQVRYFSNEKYAFFISGLADGFGGAEGNRTPDLVNASDALSQLSYGPDPMG